MSPARLIVPVVLALVGCDGGDIVVEGDASRTFDTAPSPDTAARDTAPLPIDRTTGKPCTDDSQCDVTGQHLAHCPSTSVLRAPTGTCELRDPKGGGACDTGDGSSVPLCDGGLGLCIVDAGVNVCLGLCQLDDAGRWVHACAGKNACELLTVAESDDKKTAVFGACRGGCVVDGDCATGACDPLSNRCVAASCTVAKDCTARLPAPGFGCGVGGVCRFAFAKIDGEPCTPDPTATIASKDCFCLGRVGGVTGVCASVCKTTAPGVPNPECSPGFACDPQLDAKAPLTFDVPAGIAGRCVRTCSADSDCGIPGFTCSRSPGGPSKTCHPPV